jgi:hypothetical protein
VQIERACVTALLVPLLLAGVGAAWISVGERLGLTPLAGDPPANSAEAAAIGSAGDVYRFLRAGENPHAVYAVRPAFISSAVLRATTLEAAMWSREIEMIWLLESEGAMSDADRPALACLAVDLGLDEIAEYLMPGSESRCVRGQAMGQVVARSSNLVAVK